MRHKGRYAVFLVGLAIFWAHQDLVLGQPKIKPPIKSGEVGAALKSAAEKAQKANAPAKTVPKPSPETKADSAPAPQASSGDSASEAEIRQGAAKFVELYNGHDAKAVSELFAPKAEFTDEQGQLIKGREAIQQNFEKTFAENPECRIELEVSSVRVLSPHIAIEEGVVRGQTAPEQPQNVSNYVVVHVRLEDRWQIASVSDYESDDAPLTAHDYLEELSWMVGDWLDETPESIALTNCRWDETGNYLLHEFSIEISGRKAATGTMRIGWDPLAAQLRSWTFDSDGGYSSGLWSRSNDEWTLKSQGVNSEGKATSATVVFRYVDQDTMTWRSYDRFVGGEPAPDAPELIIKRHPPPPQN